MDSNLDRFLVYDFKGTTAYAGPNDEKHDYTRDQSKIQPNKRKFRFLTPEEYWSTDEPQMFHICCTHYGNAWKFKKWLDI